MAAVEARVIAAISSAPSCSHRRVLPRTRHGATAQHADSRIGYLATRFFTVFLLSHSRCMALCRTAQAASWPSLNLSRAAAAWPRLCPLAPQARPALWHALDLRPGAATGAPSPQPVP